MYYWSHSDSDSDSESEFESDSHGQAMSPWTWEWAWTWLETLVKTWTRRIGGWVRDHGGRVLLFGSFVLVIVMVSPSMWLHVTDLDLNIGSVLPRPISNLLLLPRQKPGPVQQGEERGQDKTPAYNYTVQMHPVVDEFLDIYGDVSLAIEMMPWDTREAFLLAQKGEENQSGCKSNDNLGSDHHLDDSDLDYDSDDDDDESGLYPLFKYSQTIPNEQLLDETSTIIDRIISIRRFLSRPTPPEIESHATSAMHSWISLQGKMGRWAILHSLDTDIRNAKTNIILQIPLGYARTEIPEPISYLDTRLPGILFSRVFVQGKGGGPQGLTVLGQIAQVKLVLEKLAESLDFIGEFANNAPGTSQVCGDNTPKPREEEGGEDEERALALGCILYKMHPALHALSAAASRIHGRLTRVEERVSLLRRDLEALMQTTTKVSADDGRDKPGHALLWDAGENKTMEGLCATTPVLVGLPLIDGAWVVNITDTTDNMTTDSDANTAADNTSDADATMSDRNDTQRCDQANSPKPN